MGLPARVPLRLEATVAASAYDPYYEAAFVFCRDAERDYVFAVSRSPDRDEIDLTVKDALAHRVTDLDLRWDGLKLSAWLDDATAARLDGQRAYEIRLDVDPAQAAAVSTALARIFEGKRGLQLLA